MTEQTKAWLVQGKITCPDVAEMWGRNIGDAEFMLLDHPDNPGSSADFPSKKAAMDWAKAKGIAVVDMTEQTHITLTGPMAGQPACGISRGDMIAQGGRGMHLPYLSSKGLLVDFALQHISCDDCRAVVFESIHRRA